MSRVLINTVQLVKNADSAGAQQAQEIDKVEGASATFQATLSDTVTPAATVDIEVSNDKSQWIKMGTITLSGAEDTDGFASSASWKYVRANVTSISGASADVTVTMGG